mmetsp:Transcript_84704/g.132335  ORF Transcript_84704/g.132335 Transcript_84704/m.132335 type:complete len:452 (-) Transcript_84704:109-1464(-)
MTTVGGQASPSPELILPENEFLYSAGSTERPWSQFTGRWQAIKPRLADICRAVGSSRPLRIVDVGSCTGFFSLQAAYQHPEADVIGVEGSVGIGNGVVGTTGSVRQIVRTPAVQTHLRWIQRLSLRNSMIAPEVWDYNRICQLHLHGRPISDVTFLLSVVHHIDNVSLEQYAAAGLSKADGTADLLAKILSLAPNHFVELPYKPWLPAAYDAFSSARGILEAASKRSQYKWRFVGPIYNADWFGPRDVWLIQVQSEMPPIDLTVNPFLQLVSDPSIPVTDRFEDLPSADASVLDPYGGASKIGHTKIPGSVDIPAMTGLAMEGVDPLLDSVALGPIGGVFASEALGNYASCQHVGGSLLIDPVVTAACAEPHGMVEDRIGDLLQQAPTSLLLAHLTLREAMNEATELLREVRESGIHQRAEFVDAPTNQAPAQGARPHGGHSMATAPQVRA